MWTLAMFAQFWDWGELKGIRKGYFIRTETFITGYCGFDTL